MYIYILYIYIYIYYIYIYNTYIHNFYFYISIFLCICVSIQYINVGLVDNSARDQACYSRAVVAVSGLRRLYKPHEQAPS